MNIMGMKLDWKLIAVAVSLVVIVAILVPGALSLLIFLACPLMMLFMMGGMGHGSHAMHGQEQSNQPALPPHNTQSEQELAQLRSQVSLLREEVKRLENREVSAAGVKDRTER
ncbi:MAG TPA: DUF2933 domain-containing protein [Chloroflexia bacterium]|nr:DUF2933 domain-containing protein [Chloroflexia bacterium]